MSQRGAGLRVRLFAVLLGAGLLALLPVAIALLLEVRDAVYARRLRDARERLAAAASAADRCAEPTAATACWDALSAQLGGARAEVLVAGPCAPGRQGETVTLCEELPRTRFSLRLKVDLREVREELDRLAARLLATLGAGYLVFAALSGLLLERTVVRRLAGVDAALGRVGVDDDERALLPEGGDAVGHLGAAVNRLARRLRDERVRTRDQIGALEQANREIRAAREGLQRSERLASVGRLAAGVAHEVGNPVAALIGYAALVRERLAQGKDVAGYAERIEREAQRIDRILRDLLDLARPPAQQLGRVQLSRAVAQARALVEPQPNWQGTSLEEKLPPDLPAVRGDEHYVVQVLMNLFTNAARAGGRTVTLSARVEPGAVLVEVADDGRGIAPEVLPRLFEPFVTTAAPGEGTGLGLALCHATMERIGGSITARAGAEQGTVFELRFQRDDRVD